MKPLEIAFSLLRIPVDFLMTLMAFLLAYHIRRITDLLPGIQLPLDSYSFPPLQEYMGFALTGALMLIGIFAINKMYSLERNFLQNKEIGRVFVLTLVGLMMMIAYYFLTRSFPFSRLVLIYTWIFSTAFIVLGRVLLNFIQNSLLHLGIGKKKLVFIGDNSITRHLWQNLNRSHHYTCLGFVDHKEGNDAGLNFLGKIEDFEKIIKDHEVDEVIQVKTDLSRSEAGNIFEVCREHHIDFSFVPDLLELQQSNVESRTIGGIPVIELRRTPLDGWGKVLKRTFDLGGAIVGITLLSPLFLLTALAIKLDSRGTVFFKYLDDGSRVKRVGQYNKLFHFHKFRTMYPNVHNQRYTTLAAHNTREGTPLVKIKNDPRVTRVGKFLRKTSIDELPQLFNVLKGEMSLVGPRPHLPEEVEKYQKHHRFVLTMKPGITGLAQISGRSDLDFEEEIRLDTYYIEHWSLWLDLKIIFKTFGVIVKGYRE